MSVAFTNIVAEDYSFQTFSEVNGFLTHHNLSNIYMWDPNGFKVGHKYGDRVGLLTGSSGPACEVNIH